MSSYGRFLQLALKSQQSWARTAGKAGAYWVFPGLLTAGWLLWPALDQEWLQSMGLASDPSAVVKQVQAAKVARMEAHLKAKGIDPSPKAAPKKEEEDEEEEEEEEAPPAEEEEEEEEAPPAEEEEQEEEAPPADEEESAPADEEEDASEEGGDDSGDDDEDEDEDEGPPPKPLYDPVKGRDLTYNEMWDNFALKSVRMNDEDDDDDDEDEDEDDE